MFRKLLLATTFVWPLIFLTGCLTSESKEYRFQVNPDGSGTGTITFVNIVSQDDEERDVSFKDFGELVTDYLEGSDFEDQNSAYHVTGKRLFERDGKLMGEIAFSFGSLDSIGFFRQPNCDCCPTLLYSEAFQETYAESDGKYLGETSATPFIQWAPGTKEFYVKTTVLDDLSNTRALLTHWQDWKKNDKSGER